MKSFLISIILSSICSHVIAQKHVEEFSITQPETKVEYSLYHKIGFIDSRDDTTNLGIVQLGPFNKKAKVITEVPLASQLSGLLNALTDSTAKDGTLLFQLRQFSFAEITGGSGERGYCYLRAVLYVDSDGTYRELGFVDTVVVIRSLDVTRALLRSGSKLINDFIAVSLTQEAYGKAAYSYIDVVHIDSIEKQNMIVYNITHYVDGFYANYQSFMDMVPDGLITDIDIRNDKIYSVKTSNNKGKPEKLKIRDVYAIVHSGNPLIATDYGYYPLQKSNNDFYFTGKAQVSANTGDVVMANLFFGVIGGLMASETGTATFNMKLDHLTGGFIRLSEVK